MFKVECWIERVQTETYWSRNFSTFEEAKGAIESDFVMRKSDNEFLKYGGYHVFEQVWKPVSSPNIERYPSLVW